MKHDFSALFQPIQVGGVVLKNRIVHCAMGGTSLLGLNNDTYETGIEDYYRGLAKGGVGLIIPGVTQIKTGSHFLDEYSDLFYGPVRRTIQEIHSYGTKYFMQLGAGFGRTQLFGIDSTDPEVRHTLLVAPSDGIPNVWVPALKHRGLTREEIHEIVVHFGRVAKICQEVGIDGIELHAVHEGYLLDQFSIRNTNHRNDEYGGSLENRLRFCCELIQEIHRVCGNDYPVSVRYSVTSKMKGFNQGCLPAEAYDEFGRNLEESPRAAQILEAAGADMLNSDNGSYDSWWWAHPPVYMPLHCNFPEVSYLKQFVHIPVFCAGRMEDPFFASQAIAKGEIDGIGVARQFLADPEWVNKVAEDRLEEIRPCIACHNGCFAVGKIPPNDGRDFIMGHCALRPATRAEKKWELKPTATPRHVAVVGGGIGGMEAARILTLRGHQVTLFEKSGELGGVFIAAAAPDFKEKDKMLIAWYKHQMELLHVPVRLNTAATPELLKEYEEIIVATGATPRKLNLPGLDHPQVIQATDYLLRKQKVGQQVVVVGGGLTGIEITYELMLHGKTPVVVEMLPDILQVPGLCAANSNFLREALAQHQVALHTQSALQAVHTTQDGRLNIEIKEGGKTVLLPADHVILSVGYIPDRTLAEALTAAGKKVHLLGDANKVANVMNAIYTAYRICYEI